MKLLFWFHYFVMSYECFYFISFGVVSSYYMYAFCSNLVYKLPFFLIPRTDLSLECAHQYYQIVFTLFYSH